MLNPSADREVNHNYRLSTEKARQWWDSQGFESRKNIVIESDAVINDDELVEDQTVADIADQDYDELPDVTKQEVDSQIDDEEDVEEIFDIEGEEYLQCSKCDDMFTSNEDYDIHKSVDHGEEPEDFEESEETYQLTMHPELTRESLKEANDLLRETKPTQLYSGYDKTGGVQSSVMPYNVPSVATGKYNDNPNEFFYSNKIFRAGSSSLRTSSLGENVNDEIKYDGFGNVDMEDGFSQGQWDELDADMDSMDKQDEKIKKWREQGLTDDEIRVKLQNGESKASESSDTCPNCGSDKTGSVADKWGYISGWQDNYCDNCGKHFNADGTSMGESKVKAREWELPAELQGLIPNSGSVSDPDLEELRKAMNTYYEVSNNGGGNWYDGADGDTKSLMQNYNLSDTERLEAFHVDNNENQYDGYGNDIEIDTDEEDRLMRSSMSELETIINQLIEKAKGKINQNNWNLYESKASEVSDLDKEGIFKLLSEMYEDYNRDNGSGISVGGYGFIYVEREFPHLTKKEINKTIDDWHNTYSFGESKASEDQHTDSWDEKYGQDLCPICKDSGNCNSMVFHAKLWNDVKEKSDESLKADWDDSVYEEKYTWLKDLGVDDAFKYSNMTLYELPEEVWQKVNEDYVQGFKQMTGESYKPDQQNAVETVEDKIISRKLDGTPVGQIARELVLWNNFSEENATKIVGEVEPSDNDMVANTLFNKRYSECNESEIQEMELYDA